MVTFRVDDVTPAAEALPTRPLGELFPDAFAFGGDPAEVPVLGSSLALLLHAALDSGGDIAHLETGRLAQLDQSFRPV